MKENRKVARVGVAICLLAVLALSAVTLASCGGSDTKSESGSSTNKLPPGVTEADAGSSASGGSSTPSSSGSGGSSEQGAESSSSGTSAAVSTPSVIVDLAGGRFTLTDATRPDSNKSVVSGGGGEVKGDYLECEFTIQNIGSTGDLVDLSEYSFRLASPGIAADTYADYYGESSAYGTYVDDNEISASLLSYSSLQPVATKVKIGQEVTKVFCFFDLNPLNVARNTDVTKDNTTVIIHKTSGTDYGDEVSIPLAGYPD